MTRARDAALRRVRQRLERALARNADLSAPWEVRKRAARAAANWAEHLGLLTRPRVCQWCRRHAELHRHHPWHDQPLNVIFLCRDCHGLADAMEAG